jgi:hypothetical protein
MRRSSIYEGLESVLTNAPDGKNMCYECGTWRDEDEDTFPNGKLGRCVVCMVRLRQEGKEKSVPVVKNRHIKQKTDIEPSTCLYCGQDFIPKNGGQAHRAKKSARVFCSQSHARSWGNKQRSSVRVDADSKSGKVGDDWQGRFRRAQD